MSSTELQTPEGDSVLFVVDASTSMRNSEALRKVLIAVYKSILDVQWRGDRHFDTGLLLYNVKGGAKQFLSLSHPRIDDMKQLRRMAYDRSVYSRLVESLDSSSGLRDAWKLAKLEFAKLDKRSVRRLVVITDDDDPTIGDERLTAETLDLSVGLGSIGVLIIPLFVKHAHSVGFDATRFWSSVSYSPPAMRAASTSEGLPVSLQLTDVDDVSTLFKDVVRSKTERKTHAFRGRLRLRNLEMGINGYNIVRTSLRRRPLSRPFVFVKGPRGTERIEAVSTTRRFADSVTRAEVDEDDVTRRYVLSNRGDKAADSVPVSKSDLEELHVLSNYAKDALIEIHGFVPVENLAPHRTVGHSVLIVPSNMKLANSKSAFPSLHRSMTRQKVAAIVTSAMPQTLHKPPTLGLLYSFDPASPLFDSQRTPEPSTSSGLYLVPSAYTEDLRDPPPHVYTPHRPAAGSADLRKLMTMMLYKFRLESGFSPAKFSNPRISQFAYVLEHLALSLAMDVQEDGKTIIEQRDATRPNYMRIERSFGPIAREIQQVLQESELSSPVSTPPSQSNSGQMPGTHQGPQPSSQPVTKKIKVERLPQALENIKDAWKVGTLRGFSISDLLWACHSLNIHVESRSKSMLIEKLSHAFSQDPS